MIGVQRLLGGGVHVHGRRGGTLVAGHRQIAAVLADELLLAQIVVGFFAFDGAGMEENKRFLATSFSINTAAMLLVCTVQLLQNLIVG